MYDDADPTADIWAQRPGPDVLPTLLCDNPERWKQLWEMPADEDPVEWGIYLTRAMEAAARFLFPMGNTGIAKRLYRIRQPTLLVNGANDRVIPALIPTALRDAPRWACCNANHRRRRAPRRTSISPPNSRGRSTHFSSTNNTEATHPEAGSHGICTLRSDGQGRVDHRRQQRHRARHGRRYCAGRRRRLHLGHECRQERRRASNTSPDTVPASPRMSATWRTGCRCHRIRRIARNARPHRRLLRQRRYRGARRRFRSDAVR